MQLRTCSREIFDCRLVTVQTFLILRTPFCALLWRVGLEKRRYLLFASSAQQKAVSAYVFHGAERPTEIVMHKNLFQQAVTQAGHCSRRNLRRGVFRTYCRATLGPCRRFLQEGRSKLLRHGSPARAEAFFCSFAVLDIDDDLIPPTMVRDSAQDLLLFLSFQAS